MGKGNGINAAGGGLDPSARGVDEEEFARAVPLGVTKVNIDTDGRLVWTRVHREFFRDSPDKFDFRGPGKIFMAEYGVGEKTNDVTAILRKYAKNYRIIYLPSASYIQSLGGDTALGIVMQLKIQYRIDGKEGEVSLNENAMIVLPMPT